MTNEEEIEEILMEAHAHGLRIEVMETAQELMLQNPKMPQVTAYQLAFNDWVK